VLRTLVAFVFLAAGSAARADDAPETPFDQGKIAIGIYGGTQSSLGFRYYAIGGALGYYVLDGVEVSGGTLFQFGDGPNILRLTPSVRYVAQPLVGHSPLIPYVGVFYNHWFIGDSYSDVDAVGGRTGLLYVSGRAILGLGVAYERVVSECVTDCSSVYPDFTISVSL
jgi:hypothetical protein